MDPGLSMLTTKLCEPTVLQVGVEELKELDEELQSLAPGQKLWYKVSNEIEGVASALKDNIQVKWTRVPELVGKRQVVLKRGWAYVPAKEQASIVFQEFQTKLEDALEVSAQAYLAN